MNSTLPIIIAVVLVVLTVAVVLGSCMVILAKWKDWRRAQLVKDQR